MKPVMDATVDEIITTLLRGMRRILEEKLVGLYLFGSLVAGDFEVDTSDIDLLAVLASELDDLEFDQLESA